jgi:hypothetical protein
MNYLACSLGRRFIMLSLLCFSYVPLKVSAQMTAPLSKEGVATNPGVDPNEAHAKDSRAPARLAPALDPVARRQILVGRWYGESTTPDGRLLRWLTDREANGTYRTHYLLLKERQEESTEVGQWGLSGSVFFTIQRAWIRDGETQRVDSSNVYSYDAYDLLQVSEQNLEYRSASSGKRFVVRRVSPNFELPISSSK